MVVDESWIGAEVETASEGGCLLLLAKHRHNTNPPRVSAPSPNASETPIVRTKSVTLTLRHHVTPGV